MRDGEPSQTAKRVAVYRLGFERVPAPFGDPVADERLTRDVSGGVGITPDENMARYLHVRTAFFDRVVLDALQRGCTQVVTVGAGYDGRALRYAKSGVRWFEVDHPATQADKRERLTRLEIATSNITFVAADLSLDNLAAKLTESGFVSDSASLLLCEGLAVYLDSAVLAELLWQLRSIAAADTRLAISGGVAGADASRRQRFVTRVAQLGEPAASSGAELLEILPSARWRATTPSERAQRAGLILCAPV